MPYAPDIEAMPRLIRDFAYYKRVIQNRSQKTVDEYALDLQTFFRYLINKRAGRGVDAETMEETDLSAVDTELVKSVKTEEIYEFLMYASSERRNGQAARARKLSAVRAFYKYLTNTAHIIEENPAANIESPSQGKRLPKFLSLDESLALLDAVKNDALSKTKTRDYAIITLFLNCGMRLSELCGISMNDLDLKELRSMRVVGKGAKERVIYLNDACRSALIEWLKARAELIEQKGAVKDGSPLFLSSRHSRISAKTVQWMVYKYLGEAGLDYRRYSVHKLRHTAATLMYQTGEVDIRVLKDILGHEQLNTTQIYTHVSDAGMEAAMKRNPLNSEDAPKADAYRKLDIDDGDDDEDTE